jgi:Obg family GTPase CgtA-like protein
MPRSAFSYHRLHMPCKQGKEALLMCTPFVLGEDERLDEINAQLRLIQKKNGLTFGTDAYLLSAFVRPAPHDRAVDLGSGTGVIPLLLTAKQKIAHACAIEIQPAFAALIERNVALNDPDSMAYFQKILREKGVISQLKQMGIKEKDTVIVGDVEFDFIP